MHSLSTVSVPIAWKSNEFHCNLLCPREHKMKIATTVTFLFNLIKHTVRRIEFTIFYSVFFLSRALSSFASCRFLNQSLKYDFNTVIFIATPSLPFYIVSFLFANISETHINLLNPSCFINEKLWSQLKTIDNWYTMKMKRVHR